MRQGDTESVLLERYVASSPAAWRERGRPLTEAPAEIVNKLWPYLDSVAQVLLSAKHIRLELDLGNPDLPLFRISRSDTITISGLPGELEPASILEMEAESQSRLANHAQFQSQFRFSMPSFQTLLYDSLEAAIGRRDLWRRRADAAVRASQAWDVFVVSPSAAHVEWHMRPLPREEAGEAVCPGRRGCVPWLAAGIGKGVFVGVWAQDVKMVVGKLLYVSAQGIVRQELHVAKALHDDLLWSAPDEVRDA